MSIRVLVNGAFGRMGQLTTKAIKEQPDFELVGQTGREYELAKSIIDSRADVVIDFTTPEVVFQNTLTIMENGARPVIGTSGLTLEEVKTLQKKAAELKRGGIIAPNFSVGAVLMMQFAREAAKLMPNVEIIEMHHAGKMDSPSGTALRTAQLISSSRGEGALKHESLETVPGARGANYQNIPIHSVRLPGLLAFEQVIFGELGETLTLQHNSIDRQCFMPGVCLAVRKVMGLEKLTYGLEEILM